MNQLEQLNALGLTLPTPAYLAGALLFGIVGIAAFRYGKRNCAPIPKWIGIALMLYPYAISQTWLLYGLGAGLCAALYFFRQ